MTEKISPYDLGLQPLDEYLNRLGISNADLVEASTAQLTHKMVQRGRKGRRLTRRVQDKILEAIGAVRPGQDFTITDLFNY